jgi:hypothetical protein
MKKKNQEESKYFIQFRLAYSQDIIQIALKRLPGAKCLIACGVRDRRIEKHLSFSSVDVIKGD